MRKASKNQKGKKLDARGLPLEVQTDRRGFVKCRVCSCTEDRACDPPCSWAEPGLCSGCAQALSDLDNWAEGAWRANGGRLLREFNLLRTTDKMRALVRALRSVTAAD